MTTIHSPGVRDFIVRLEKFLDPSYATQGQIRPLSDGVQFYEAGTVTYLLLGKVDNAVDAPKIA
ncbi:hypothetical protein EON65_17535 [archaeon]|nr:MAG: hypothetical protein EON65_17535 [archaeon]